MTNLPMAPQIFPGPGLVSFPVSAFVFLFWLLSISSLFCFWRYFFSFVISSSHPLVLVSGCEIFSISLKPRLVRVFRSVLALGLPLLLRQMLSSTSIFENAAIPLTLAMRGLRSILRLLISLSRLGWAIFLTSLTRSSSFSSASNCLPPLWLWPWQPGWVIWPGSGFLRRR